MISGCQSDKETSLKNIGELKKITVTLKDKADITYTGKISVVSSVFLVNLYSVFVCFFKSIVTVYVLTRLTLYLNLSMMHQDNMLDNG